MGRRLARGLIGALALFLFLSSWRSALASAAIPISSAPRSPLKRHRRCPTDLPQNPLRTLDKRAQSPGPVPSGMPATSPETGFQGVLGAPAAPGAGRSAAFEGRPDYLRAFLHEESHSTLSPPQR